MKQYKLNGGLLVLAVLSVTALAVSPASARHGLDDSTTTTVATTQSTSGDDSSTETEVHQSGNASERLATLKTQAKSELSDLRKGKPETSVAKRQKLCENRQTAVDNKVKAFGNAADKHLAKLDSIFTKLQAYQTDKQLDATTYQTLVDTATAKQQAATDAVTALKQVTVNIDCTSTDPASSLTVVKTAAKNARTALQDYRMSLKAIVVAFAQSNQTDNSTGGTE